MVAQPDGPPIGAPATRRARCASFRTARPSGRVERMAVRRWRRRRYTCVTISSDPRPGGEAATGVCSELGGLSQPWGDDDATRRAARCSRDRRRQWLPPVLLVGSVASLLHIPAEPVRGRWDARASRPAVPGGRRSIAAPEQRQPHDDENGTEREEPEVPWEWRRDVVTDVVHAEQVMIDETLDQVERTPADEEETDVRAPWRGHPSLLPHADGKPHPDEHEDPRRQVEQTVGDRVRLQPGDRRRRVSVGGRQHVMPLQDLVQDDAIDEAAQPDAQQQTGQHGWSRAPGDESAHDHDLDRRQFDGTAKVTATRPACSPASTSS